MTTKEYGKRTRKKIYDYIENYVNKHGYAPSPREVADGIDASETNIGKQMRSMLANGMLITDISTDRLLPRAYRLGIRNVE